MLQRRRSFLLSSAMAAGAVLRRGPATQRVRLVARRHARNVGVLAPYGRSTAQSSIAERGCLWPSMPFREELREFRLLLGGSADVVAWILRSFDSNQPPKDKPSSLCDDDAVPGQCDHHVSASFRKDTQHSRI